MKNGKVYIASNEKTISAFNLSKPKGTTIQTPFDVSQKKYYVESSVAVAQNDTGQNIVISFHVRQAALLLRSGLIWSALGNKPKIPPV